MTPEYSLPYLSITLECPRCWCSEQVIVKPDMPPFGKLGYPKAVTKFCLSCGNVVKYFAVGIDDPNPHKITYVPSSVSRS